MKEGIYTNLTGTHIWELVYDLGEYEFHCFNDSGTYLDLWKGKELKALLENFIYLGEL